MRKVKKPSKGRVAASKSAQRRKPAASRAARKPRAGAVKPKRQPAPKKARRAPAKPRSFGGGSGPRPPAPKKARRAPAKPKARPAPVPARRRVAPAAAKGPSIATLQRRIQGLEEQLKARDQDRVELVRWRQYHSHLQEQVKAKDSALAFKEKELLDLRRQVEEVKAELKKKDTRT